MPRGSVTIAGDGDFKSQLGLRVGLSVETEPRARLIMPGRFADRSPPRRPGRPGSGIVPQGKSGRIEPVKFDKTDHAVIGPIAGR